MMPRMKPQRPSGWRRQRGVTLIMALIMLVVLTLLALTSFNLGKSNLLVVSNMQQRDESIAAAREVIEEAISSARFSESPEAVLLNPCDGANTRCVDTNGDGNDDVRVALTPAPTCVKIKPILRGTLNPQNEEDKKCTLGEDNDKTGMEGADGGESLCVNSVWEVRAVATDVATDARIELTQGIEVRVAKDKSDTACPN